MANLPEDKKWTGVYQWETSDRALGGPDSLFTKPTRDLTARTGYLKEQIEKGNEAFTEHEKSTNHPDATIVAKGFVKLSSAVDSTSETLAATPKAVKTAMDKANSAASAASTAQTTANTANSTANTAKTNAATAQSKADSAYSLANKANSTASSAKSTAETDATTSAKGRVQLSSAVDSTSEALAATPKAVKTAMDKANSAASAASTAQTTANTANSTANTAKTNAATAQSKADSAYTLANTANTIANTAKSTAETDASTTVKGRVQLNSAVNSTVENQAATPKAVKTAYDIANKALNSGEYWYLGGAEQSPITISAGQDLEFTNIYNDFCIFIPQLQITGRDGAVRWIDVTWHQESNWSRGIFVSVTSDKKVLIGTGYTTLLANSMKFSGIPDKYLPTSSISSAPIRLRVLK